MSPMAFFTPQKGKNTGVKGRLEGRKWLFSGIILTYLQDKQHINKRSKRLRIYTIVVFSFVRTFAP